MKLHIGCGPIYLEGYVNIDGNPDFLASNCHPDLMDRIRTTFDRYYRYGFAEGPKEVVADIGHDLSDPLPFPDGSVEEVVMEQCLEHFPSYMLDRIVGEISRVLEDGGSFVVGVPDVRETAKWLVESKTDEEEDFAIRLIHGSQRNRWSHHYVGFVPRTLKMLLGRHGFVRFEDLPAITFYPAIHLRAFKGKA